MTQNELSRLVGCTRQTVIVLGKERYVPSLSLAFRIASVFGQSIEDIFEYVEDLQVTRHTSFALVAGASFGDDVVDSPW